MDKKVKNKCWCIYFPRKPQVRTWKRTLRELVEAGYARVTFHEVSQYRVELVWHKKAVTYDSAARLVRLAKEKDASFEILDEPTGIADDVAAAPTGVADDARVAPVEAAAVAPDEAAAPETKR